MSEKTGDAMHVGVAWYRPDQWERLLAVSADADDLERTWEEWRESASQALGELRRGGVVAEQVEVDVENLLAWCNEQGRPVNGESRANYVTEVLRSKPPREERDG